MAATDAAQQVGGRLRSRAARLMMLSVGMIALSFALDGTATSVLRVLSLVPITGALAFALDEAPVRGVSRKALVTLVVVVALAAGALAYGLIALGTAQDDVAAVGWGHVGTRTS